VLRQMVLLAFIAPLFLGAGPAFAASDEDVVKYSGFATLVYPAHPDATHSFDTVAQFDCSSSPCLLTMVMQPERPPDISLSGKSPLVFESSTSSYQIAADGPCDDRAIGPGTLTVSSQGDALEFSRHSAAECGTDAEFTASGTLHKLSGRSCLLDQSCVDVGTADPVADSDGLVGLHAKSAGDPSVLSALRSTPTIFDPANLLWAAAAAIVLVLLVAFPTHLLNTAVEHGTGRLGTWWRGRRPERQGKRQSGWPIAAAGVLAASIISSFVNPDFGLNAATVRVFLSILVSFVLEAVASWFIVIWLVRRVYPGAKASFNFAPLSLLIVLAAVVFTRVTGFQPGIVFGLVAGVTFGSVLATSGRAKATLVGLGYGFGLAIIAWLGYGALEGATGPLLVFIRETLSSIAIGGIAALPIALVPLRGLLGYEVFRWKRWAWVLSYLVGLLGFFLILMPRPFSWAEVPLSIGVWVAIYLAYAIVAIALWLVVVRPWIKVSAPESELSQPRL
jgi:hypothetical protein